MITITNFGAEVNDTIELFVFNVKDELIDSMYNVPYTLQNTYNGNTGIASVGLDVKEALAQLGYISGKYNVKLQFYRNLLVNCKIQSISNSRTEIRIVPENAEMNTVFSDFAKYSKTDSLGNKIILVGNFGSDNTYDIINWITDTIAVPKYPYSYVLKLASALNQTIKIGDTISIQRRISDPVINTVSVYLESKPEAVFRLQAPNYYVQVNKGSVQSTPYRSWTDIVGTNTTSSKFLVSQYFSGSLGEESIDLNIDYRNFENFVFYGTAVDRLKNFKYKLNLIEYYGSRLSTLTQASSSDVLNNNLIDSQNKLNTILSNFDGYEKYLYYESSSFDSGSYGVFLPTTWPKTNATKPYTFYSTTSSQATDWYNASIATASFYDTNNIYSLNNLAPFYIKSDEYNENFITFLNFIGQYFDNIWSYVSAMTDISSRDESPDIGIPKDLIFHVARSLGLPVDEGKKIEELWYYTLGLNASGSFNQTGSYQSISSKDYTREVWKRLLNNYIYLLKSKGTEKGLRAISNCYGIPDTILRVKEYGGPEPTQSISYREGYVLNYALECPGTLTPNTISGSAIQTLWKPIRTVRSSSVSPRTPTFVDFRFRAQKALGVLDTSIYPSQSLFTLGNIPQISESTDYSNSTRFGIRLDYLSGSMGKLTLIVSGSSGQAYMSSSTQPINIFDGEFWDVYVNMTSSMNIWVRKQKYNKTVTLVSASLVMSSSHFNNILSHSYAYIGGNMSKVTTEDKFFGRKIFSGSFQEIKFWNYDFVNQFNSNATSWLQTRNDPQSTYGYDFTSIANDYKIPYDYLGLRFSFIKPKNHNSGSPATSFNSSSLITSQSIFSCHPDYTVNTFDSTASLSIFGIVRDRPNSNRSFPLVSSSYQYYSPVNEKVYTQWPSVGSNREIGNKVRIESSSLSTGILDSKVKTETSAYDVFPIDSNKVGMYFSPQNEINEDIAQQLGGIFLDDFIGNPIEESDFEYPSLKVLNAHYFSKYPKQYNYANYLRLVENFDSSLFHILKDFIPGRATKILGHVIEPNLLERSKANISRPINVALENYESQINMIKNTILISDNESYYGKLTQNLVNLEAVNQSESDGLITIRTATSQSVGYNRNLAINDNTNNPLQSYGYIMSRYDGVKISSPDFNIPSNDTPDGKPVVEFWLTNPNTIIAQNFSAAEGNFIVQ